MSDRLGAADRSERAPTRILFVCLGNICRSPTAEAAMRDLLVKRRLEGVVQIDSAGTGGWHVGESPDARASETASRRGLTLEGVARQVRRQDFEDFDLILAMDSANLRDLRRLAPDENGEAKVALLREFDPDALASGELDVPDPYYGGQEGFERVIDLVTAACKGVLASLRLSEGATK